MHRHATILSLATAAAFGTGFVQDPWAQQVRRQLDEVRDRMNARGFARTHDPFVGSLNDGQAERLTVQLDAGTEYLIIGACDNDCSDLDLELYNRTGGMIAQDIQADDIPVLRVEPSRSGSYQVRAIMAECSREPCRYGVGVYGD